MQARQVTFRAAHTPSTSLPDGDGLVVWAHVPLSGGAKVPTFIAAGYVRGEERGAQRRVGRALA